MARRGAPSLYELLRKAPAKGVAAPPASAPLHHHAPPQPIVFQVPLVWAVGLGALAVLVIIGAYLIGSRGTSRGETAGEGTPAAHSDTPQGGAPIGGTQGDGSNAQVPPVAPNRSGQGAPLPPATDNTGDPRMKGYKYFVLAHPSTERAPGMVEFCRGNGLDAYLVPDDNAMLRKIVVLPGYRDSSEKSSEPIRKLEAEIRRVGEKWKNAARGNKDFSDAYPEMYR